MVGRPSGRIVFAEGETRNPNVEARNKLEILSSNAARAFQVSFLRDFFGFRISSFGFLAMDLRPHIEKFSRRFAEVEAALSDPKAFDNPQRAQELSKEYARLKELTAQGQTYLKTAADLAENRALLKSESVDSELAQMAKE